MSRRGFTLFEVMVALVLSGSAVLTAHALFRPVIDAAAAISSERGAIDREANSRRLLRSTLLSVEVGASNTVPFAGHGDRLEVSAWMPTADGWFELKEVRIGQAGSRLVLTAPDWGVATLGDSLSDVRFDYLVEPGINARWVADWTSPVSAPLALRLRVRRDSSTEAVADTMVYLIGMAR